MSAQPEALRLAERLKAGWGMALRDEAAAELRRLVAENEALRAELTIEQALSFRSQVAELQAKNEALLGAMKLIQHATAPTHNDDAYHEAAHDISSAATDAARSKA